MARIKVNQDLLINKTFVNSYSDGFNEVSKMINLPVGEHKDFARQSSSKMINNRYTVSLPYQRYRLNARYTPVKAYQQYERFARNPTTGNWAYVLAFSKTFSYPQYWTNLSRHYLSEKDPDPTNKSLKRFYDKLSEFRANMAVIFAQRQEAIEMAGKRLIQVFQALLDVKKGRFKSAARRLGVRKPRSKEVSGAWLELQYGWLPLISDVYALLDLAPIPFENIKGRAYEFSSYRGWLGADVMRKRWVEYGALVAVSDTGVAFANSIGLVNPALVAWEIVPFSFVIDWALPIGEHLDYLTAKVGLSFNNAYCSVKTLSTVYYKDRDSGLSIDAVETNFERSKLDTTSFPVPKLEFENPISPMHLANAIALGRQIRN